MYYGLTMGNTQYPCNFNRQFTNIELRNIIKKARIIKNLDISTTMINRANKSELYNIINKFNIDKNKIWYNNIFIREFNKFNNDKVKYKQNCNFRLV